MKEFFIMLGIVFVSIFVLMTIIVEILIRCGYFPGITSLWPTKKE